jgi:hypothetical protein
MLIELDLEEAKRLGITVNQFILISLLMNKTPIRPLLDVLPIDESDINNLIDKEIFTKESIFDIKDFTKLIITEDFKSKIKVKDYFTEFFDSYPIVVLRNDGLKDYLRGDVSRCRKYYDKIVGTNKDKHDHMMECLRFEVETRKRSNSLGYMKRMAKWLLSEEWLLYDEFMKDKKIQKHAGEVYGTTIE